MEILQPRIECSIISVRLCQIEIAAGYEGGNATFIDNGNECAEARRLGFSFIHLYNIRHQY